MEISAADIDPQPKRNQKPRPKKQTVGKPKLSKIFEVSQGKKGTKQDKHKKPCKCKKTRSKKTC